MTGLKEYGGQQIVQTLIRLLLQGQSDQGLHCLLSIGESLKFPKILYLRKFKF